MPFRPGSLVDVEEVSDTDWRVLREIYYQGSRQAFVVPAGAMTDFASVPRVLVWFLPRYGRYTKAAILHDHLWRKLVPAGELSLPDADGIFRRAMRELGVPFLKRWIMWGAVRLGALMKPGGRTRWIRHSWAVFPLALLTLPIVGPPAIIVSLSLAVFTIVEFVAYLPLRIARAVRMSRGQPVKAVNAPTLEWKPA